jgi:hypothetical protein
LYATQVIETDGTNLKAWQRRAVARQGKGDASGYIHDLDAALKLAPESRAISTELRQALQTYLHSKGLAMPSRRAVAEIKVDLISSNASVHGPRRDSGPEDAATSTSATMSNGTSHAPLAHKKSEDVSQVVAACPASITDREDAAKPLHELKRDAGDGACDRPTNTTDAVFRLPTLQACVPDAAPSTSAEFECQWRTMRQSQEARAAYLSLIEPDRIPALFGSALTPDMLEGMVHTLLTAMQTGRSGRCIEMLRNLAQVQRFGMNMMLVSRPAKERLAKLWNASQQRLEHTEAGSELQELRKQFRL